MTRVWAKRGTRPTAVRQTQYGYVYVLAAVSTSLGMAEGMIATHLDTDIINRFLEAFSNRLPSDLHAVLVWDGAGFHQAKELRCPSNVTLVSLPPYSPELNPVENLWHYLKSHYWSNRRYANVDTLFDAAQNAWQATCLDSETMRTICAAPNAESA